ncbi:hypothetical protein BD324DRAFT_682194 [Kockovaella imperatae]|uniref:Uncharacterized protein n=1 Tax=Kockovaella imperatae TaxID=4999 RepID=A0A1Y1UEU4_9TREE|nr:hypothetical protein BD324DRAFT_682194 [Kockovaella imperatae]ORX36057.1 hypothetical protein BD324DRAFT_682194 [Kockovaella imperatae]
MEAFGLPAAFGKASVPKTGKANDGPSRGTPSGRGPRGVVGGKRARGRGRGDKGDGGVSHLQTDEGLNTGVKVRKPDVYARLRSKRPHPHSANHGRTSDSGWGGRAEARAKGGLGTVTAFPPRGGRGGGRGGVYGARSGNSGESGNDSEGYFQPSFCEDPWKDLLKARERDAKG